MAYFRALLKGWEGTSGNNLQRQLYSFTKVRFLPPRRPLDELLLWPRITPGFSGLHRWRMGGRELAILEAPVTCFFVPDTAELNTLSPSEDPEREIQLALLGRVTFPDRPSHGRGFLAAEEGRQP